MNNRKLVLAGTVVLSLGVFGFAPPAMAASTSCTTRPYNPTCSTGTLAANSSGHFIDYSTSSSYLDILNSKSYYIKDLDTGVIVKRGTFAVSTSGRVNGLYGARYQMTQTCVCESHATIDNT